MPTLIACFIAGIFAAGFVTIWFTTVYAELSAKRNSLADLDEQLRLHEGAVRPGKGRPRRALIRRNAGNKSDALL